jgi:methoxymalonate biosynthesis protein
MTTSERPTEECELVEKLVGDHADGWDVEGRLPDATLRELGSRGLLCAQVPTKHGGLGLSSAANGELTAHTGKLCSSLRSVMTSQGMAAWTIQRFGDRRQRRHLLDALTGGTLAAVGFSEPQAGSDLAAIGTTLTDGGTDDRGDPTVVVDGGKAWVTASAYADVVLVVARQGELGEHGAVVVVPTDAPGVSVEPVAAPVGCRAAGHAAVHLDRVRLPASSVLGGGGLGLTMLVTTALAYGRMSIAWGCVGILRACLEAAADHARTREQFGRPLADHQLVARHLAELLIAEQTASRTCEHASAGWDAGDPDAVIGSVLAKHVGAQNAARAASTAMQVLASAGARDGGVVARAYRDAKLMEIIEGTDEICQLLLARHVVEAGTAA